MRAVAVAVMAWAVMASGCYIDDEAYGCFNPEPLPMGECWVDADCPNVECHAAPTCIAGVCRALRRERQTVCSIGVCNADWICVPCTDNADCDAANENECYSLSCGSDGLCKSRAMQAGEACNITAGAVCGTGANCLD